MSAPGRGAPSPVFIGLMSGTSLDGISAAAARFARRRDGGVDAELVAYASVPYEPAQRERLLRAMERGDAEEYCRLDFDLGAWLADAARALMDGARLGARDVGAVGSHGQTLWHAPPHSTWQIGESAVIAERLGVPVVSDFRVRDVAAGGQGAPLVPIADTLLFAAPGHARAMQNLGGIGNVSVIPPLGGGEPVLAFDTGPGVCVIDGVVRALVPGKAFDEEGALARRGRAIEDVVTARLADPYFAAPPPKSTGRELFTRGYVERFVADCRAARPDATTEDIVATAVRLTARSIGDAYARFVDGGAAEVVLSGGGARNPALVEAIAAAVAPRAVRRFDELFFDGEAKEAVAFALLAWLHVEGAPGNVPTATGARGPRILGKWCPA